MTEELAYQVNLDVYKGPFDLLIEAVDKNEIDIFSISLSEITSSYFEYWKREEPNLLFSSDFLYMAAYLIELKSKNILPAKEELLQQEIIEIEDSLVDHIQEYQVFKNIAQTLKARKEVFEKVYGRHEGEAQYREFELVDVSLKDLLHAFKRVYDQAAKRGKIVEIEAEEVTIEQRIEEIKSILAGKKQGVPFEDIFLRMTRLEIMVSFLAILELAKQRYIRIAQGGRFGSIMIIARGEEENEHGKPEQQQPVMQG
ncbi:MAG: segregation/condensation protein A [Candidatus Margulisbacteria bacterium]|nr:segregation/condensation protein A [Candidatus Margulisiibacteriota bacterium]